MIRPLFLLAALLLVASFTVACGDDDDAKTDTTTDTATEDTNGGNDTSSDTAEDTAADTTSDEGQDTRTPAPDYTEYAFGTCDPYTPSGEALTGVYTLVDGCQEGNPIELLDILCQDIIVLADPAPVPSFTGTLVFTDGGTFAQNYVFGASATIWVADACVRNLAGGTCEGLSSFIENDIQVANLTVSAICTDDTEFGGCLCDVDGSILSNSAGTWTGSAGTYTAQDINDSGTVNTNTVIAQDLGDGMWGMSSSYNGNTSIFRYEGALTSMCQDYCAHFMGICNREAGIETYDSIEDCMTQCAGFTVSGEALPVTTGNSLECRTTHVHLAVDPSDVNNPATHCVHAQATATAPCN